METTTSFPSYTERKMEILTFSWIDYALFVGMFVISLMIGVYFGCFGSKQSTTKEYLLGNKKMKVFPIAMSLIASNQSGLTFLSIPAEVYMFGTQFWMCVLSTVILVICMVNIYLPVFYKLQVSSSYEYLMMRFDQRIRNVTSIFFILKTFLHIPIVVYVPALTINQVTGIDVHFITPLVCGICIIYTTIGGLKAVVWADTVQLLVTFGGMLTVFYLGIVSAGGLSEIWKNAEEGDRIEFFNMNPDPTERISFWAIAIGLSMFWTGHTGLHQACVQRYISLPNLKSAIQAAIILGIGISIAKSLSCFSGLIMYSKYKDCDPLSSGKVSRMDQLLVYYVMDVAKHLPGLSGIFVSGIFSTSLSSMSTSLNTLAGTIFEDFLKPNNMIKTMSDRKCAMIMKLIVVIVGVLSIGMVYLIERLGGILQAFITFASLTTGPIFGLFTLGMLFPVANTKGALVGASSALVLVSWICIGAQVNRLRGFIKDIPKPLSTEGCVDFNFTSTTQSPVITNGEDEPFWLYKISFHYYTFIGVVIVLIVGLTVSYFTRKTTDPLPNKDLLSPCIYPLLSKDYPNINKKIYQQVKQNEKEEEIITRKISLNDNFQ